MEAVVAADVHYGTARDEIQSGRKHEQNALAAETIDNQFSSGRAGATVEGSERQFIFDVAPAVKKHERLFMWRFDCAGPQNVAEGSCWSLHP
jgi:hypothetical protein